MKRVKSTITLDKRVINRLDNAQLNALYKTAEYVHTEVVQARVIPRDTGALQNEKFYVNGNNISKGSVSLCFEGPYARRLYFHPEYHFNRENWTETVNGVVKKHGSNPNAKGKWLEDWCPRGKNVEAIKKAYAKFFRMEAGL